ncbi:mitotic spindle assembly checkpoint protein MAD2A-like [Schistocerca gregaria]|uniref:mitotic spindle assembly checkpoint protein MAD2A-like n=1 Tax=Schistocerca gregaria TaxID=7010 RepID=UPI00211E7225|nr:mitotic spindle assembly checkpoint protein MAD2A-like [Schistocerca gregaria]
MATVTQSNITLRGSTKIVVEFFDYAINSILYQRGIYPPEDFEQKKKYGISIMVAKDAGLRDYMNQILSQLTSWLMTGDIQKLVVVIADNQTKETKERWNFDIQTDMEMAMTGSDKPQSEIVAEIRTIIRQITSSVTYLPLLENPCTFDLLVYTSKKTDIPETWEESEPKYIVNSDQVKLYSFNTKIHQVDSLVSFKSNLVAE